MKVTSVGLCLGIIAVILMLVIIGLLAYDRQQNPLPFKVGDEISFCMGNFNHGDAWWKIIKIRGNFFCADAALSQERWFNGQNIFAVKVRRKP